MGIILFLLSSAGVYFYRLCAIRYQLLDIPNERSMHQTTIPRGAGMVFLLLWSLSLLFLRQQDYLSLQDLLLLLPGGCLVAILGFVDDRYSLSAGKRLMIQCLAAGLFVSTLGDFGSLRLFGPVPLHLGLLAPILAIFLLVWSINAYNFMDGIDGISGVEAISVFGMGAWLFWEQGVRGMGLASWALACIVSGFLLWNWPKAKIFMGDAGSYCLGFAVAAFALIGDQHYGIPLMLWLIIYGVFCFDASATLLRRLYRGEKLSEAHSLHAYQRLQRAGFGGSSILGGLCTVNALLAGIVYSITRHPSLGLAGFLLAVFIVAALYAWIESINPMWSAVKSGIK